MKKIIISSLLFSFVSSAALAQGFTEKSPKSDRDRFKNYKIEIQEDHQEKREELNENKKEHMEKTKEDRQEKREEFKEKREEHMEEKKKTRAERRDDRDKKRSDYNDKSSE